MNLRKVVDLDEGLLDQSVRQQIEDFVAKGYKREVLVINRANRVFVDPDLAREEGYLDVRYHRGQE